MDKIIDAIQSAINVFDAKIAKEKNNLTVDEYRISQTARKMLVLLLEWCLHLN